MNNDSTEQASLTVSAIGWLLAVLLFAGALFVAKPYVQHKGYEAGRAQTSSDNIAAVDAVVKARTIEGENYVVLGRVVSTTANSVTFETLTPYLLNPLSKQARYQTATVTADTVIEKRTLLAQDEFVKALEEGRRKGLTTDQIQVHTKEPLTLAQLKQNDEIRLYPVVAQDAVKDSFAVKQILLVITNQTTPNSSAQ